MFFSFHSRNLSLTLSQKKDCFPSNQINCHGGISLLKIDVRGGDMVVMLLWENVLCTCLHIL